MVTVKFNETMITDGVNLTHINSTILHMYIRKNQSSSYDEEDFDLDDSE